MRQITGLMLVWFVSVCTGEELREWTLESGESFDAEYVITMGDKANFKLESGEMIKLEIDRLVAGDRLYIELANPPLLKTEFTKLSDQKIYELIAGQADYTLRPPERWCRYGIRIKQVGGQPYKHELHAEFYAIGKEVTGERLILLDRQDAGHFVLNKENNWSFEFRSPKQVVLQNWTVLNEIRKRGRKYYGFLILVRDSRGEIIAVDCSHNWLSENHEKLSERGIGNYMDRTCTRRFPTRPPVIR